MRTALRIVCAATLLAVSSPAAVIINNGIPDLITGDNMSDAQVAEDFSFGSAYQVTTIRFWSVQSELADYRGSVYWAIYSDSSSAPDSILQGGIAAAVTAVPTGGSTGFGYGAYQFDIPVSFQLLAGNYWLSLHNGAISNGDPTEMLWATTNPGGGSSGVYSNVPGAPSWISTLQEHAFQIEGTPVTGEVPEPGSLFLLGSGLALGLLRLKRR